MIERRFINISLAIAGTVSSLPSSTADGVQYLVQGASSGELANYNNYIIRYNGSDWECTQPRSSMLEFINSQTGEILHYDGKNWNVIASTAFFYVDCIVDFDYLSPDDNVRINNIPGISFISSQSYGNYTCDNLYMSTGLFYGTIHKHIDTQNYTVAINSNGKIYTCHSYEWNSGIALAPSAVIVSKDTGAIYRHDGTKWSPVGSEGFIFADDIVTLNYKGTTSDNTLISTKGTKFICMSGTESYTPSKLYVSSKNGAATSQDIPINSIFGIMEGGVLVSYDGNNWLPYLVPSEGCLIVSRVDNSVYVKDRAAKKFIAVSSSGTSSKNSLTNEKFILTNENIASKSLTLSESIEAGHENEVFCFVGGTVQFARTNFTASGNTISWHNKTLDSIGLKAGDVISVQYISSNSSENTLISEKFTLTSRDILSKSLELSGNIADGQENNVLCFIGGNVQFAETDFTASGNIISWKNKTLDTIGLKAGDIIVVQYARV